MVAERVFAGRIAGALLMGLLVASATDVYAQGNPEPSPNSVPGRLNALQAAIEGVQATVNTLHPNFIQPVTLATGSVLVLFREDDYGVSCVATNVSQNPVTVTTTLVRIDNPPKPIRKSTSAIDAGGMDRVLQEAFNAETSGMFWCDFSYDGPTSAIRGDLEIQNFFGTTRLISAAR